MLSNRSESRLEDPTLSPRLGEKPSQIRQPGVPSSSAVIGPKIRFKGELVGEEDLIIQGQVEGTINLKGHQLTIGEKGCLQANVKAKTVVVSGKLRGDVYGGELISIRSTSQVQGNIKANRVILEDGAKFRGSIEMDMDEPADVKTVALQLKEKEAIEKSREGGA